MSLRWKVLTYDFRPPHQIDCSPICDGETWPVGLPYVDVELPGEEYGWHGWGFCSSIEEALLNGGLWPSGRPSIVVAVKPVGRIADHFGVLQAESLRLIRPASSAEIEEGIRRLSVPFAPHAEVMAQEQIAWREALARPGDDVVLIEKGLRMALKARGLDWELRKFPNGARAVQTAYGALEERLGSILSHSWRRFPAWSHVQPKADQGPWSDDAWSVQGAWGNWVVEAWRDKGADSTNDCGIWSAWDAREALIVYYAALRGWTRCDPVLLTTGLRDAYSNGLGIALPVGDRQLGWCIGV
jgi:hypothetical protein